MTNIARKTRPVGPALIALVLLGLTAAACLPDPSAPTSDASSAISQTGEAASEPTVVLTKPPAPAAPTVAPAPPTPTLAPTPPTTVASPIATPTAIPATAPTSGAQSSAESSAIFGDLALLEERAFGYLSELSVDVGVRTSGTTWSTRPTSSWWGASRNLDTDPKSRNFPGIHPRPALTLPAQTRAAWTPTS